MQGLQTTLIFVAILLPVLHTGIAARLLIHNANKIANWQIRFHKALIGEFAVLVFALALAAGFVAVNQVVSLLDFAELLTATPILFLLFYWIGQNRLISYLSTYRGRRRLQRGMRRRIRFLTMLPTIVICLGFAATGLMFEAIKPKQPSERPVQEVSKIETMSRSQLKV